MLLSYVLVNFQILIFETKPKGVTTQTKALDEYILMVLFVLLLTRVHFLAFVLFNLDRETAVKGFSNIWYTKDLHTSAKTFQPTFPEILPQVYNILS